MRLAALFGFFAFLLALLFVISRLGRHGAPVSSLLLSPPNLSALEMHGSGHGWSMFRLKTLTLSANLVSFHSVDDISFHNLAPL